MAWCLVKHGDNFTFTFVCGALMMTDNHNSDEDRKSMIKKMKTGMKRMWQWE
jgi:hypothetical protein